VREKNANLVLKVSSSHAAGPVSVICSPKCCRPAGVIWYTIRWRRETPGAAAVTSSIQPARSSRFRAGYREP
jgi:hypothetical protein